MSLEMKMSDFGDEDTFGIKQAKEGLKNSILFKPYGTKNTQQFKREGGIVLSPSGITKFFNNSSEWYQDRTGIPTFDGNTSTVLGNAIHGSIQSMYEIGASIAKEEVGYWIGEKYGTNPKVDIKAIMKDYTPMIASWHDNYFLSSSRPDEIEHEVEILEHDEDGFKIGTFGTCDAIFGDTLVDWKTCGRKPSGIGNYEYQLMQYARALKKTGIEIKYIKIVYIQRPLKNGKSPIHTFRKKITPQMWIEAEYYKELMVNTLLLVRENPAIKDLVFRPNIVSQW